MRADECRLAGGRQLAGMRFQAAGKRVCGAERVNFRATAIRGDGEQVMLRR
jgi:hypothetical protein